MNFTIERWDPVLYENNSVPYTMVYFKPTQEFLDFSNARQNFIAITISNSDTYFNGRKLACIIRSSANFPTYRPNFFNATGYYVAVLLYPWYWYPKKLGVATFSTLDDQEDTQPVIQPIVQQPVIEKEEPNSLTTKQLICVGAIIACILIFLYIFSSDKKFNQQN